MLWFVGRLPPTTSFSKPINRVHRLFGEWERRKSFIHPSLNLIDGAGIVSRCIQFKKREVDFKLHQFSPMTRCHFPFYVGLDLSCLVATGRQAFVQNGWLAPKKHDSVDVEQMGQVTVDEPTPLVGRFPGFSQPVDIDGRCAVRFVNRTDAPVLFGKVGQRQHLPAFPLHRLAQGGFPCTGGARNSEDARGHHEPSAAVMVNKRRRLAVKPTIKGMIASVVLSEIDTMFGMQDPSQTLHQIERYMQEGRLELSEVMATQFCDMMLAKKKRDPQQQIFLLKGLRLMCDVYLLRDKADQSMASIKRMHGERKALVKILQKHAPQMLEAMQPEHEDHLRAGRLYAAAGKQRAASKAFAKCEKLSPGHLAAAHTAADLMPTKAHVDRLLAAVNAAGDVIHANGVFELQPSASPPVVLETVLASLRHASTNQPGKAHACQAEITRLEGQQAAILAGEQAANARLQSALDSLQPKHDYYQYG